MKRALAVVVLALLAAAAAVAWLNFRDEPAPGQAANAAHTTAQQVARGAYLVRAGNCIGCHTERGGVPFAGGRAIETPFGTVFSSNLTPDAAHGLGAWDSAAFWRALHNGRSRDGRLLYPAFPYPNYTLVTREDSDAMFAYLRSLPAAARANTPHRLRWPYSTQPALAVWRALYFTPGSHEAEGSRSAEWNRGAYLVRGLGHCSACHTTRNLLGASSDMMDLSGGLIPMQNWYAPSLTSPAEAGVADWQPGEVERLLRTGVSPRGTVLGPMAEVVLQSTQYLDDADLRAMAAYLQSLPQSALPAPAPVQPAVPTLERGGKLYADHCAQCHGDKGQGVAGAYPPLARNRAVNLPVTANLVQVVLHGGFPPATAGNPRPFGMPPYAMVMGDADTAAVLTFLRASWGNQAAPVSELDVARQRSASTP